MPDTPKKKPAHSDKEDKKPDPSTWEEDQKRREYYYDDAHGYEVYIPEEAEKEED